MSSILQQILTRKAQRLEEAKRQRPLSELRRDLPSRGEDRRPFRLACARPDHLNIIAEVKRASPSRGILREDFDPVALAREYESAGAVAISVLTEEDHFLGSLAHLTEIRQAVSLPLLRKDFLFDPYQLYEAAAAGADAVLLIAALLDRVQLRDLLQLAQELRLDALVEVHDRIELENALAAGAKLIGVNNRDLRTFRVDIAISWELARHVPQDVVLVSESGLSTRHQLQELRRAGYHAFLIGEYLVRAPRPSEALHMLLGLSEPTGESEAPLLGEGREWSE